MENIFKIIGNNNAEKVPFNYLFLIPFETVDFPDHYVFEVAHYNSKKVKRKMNWKPISKIITINDENQ